MLKWFIVIFLAWMQMQEAEIMEIEEVQTIITNVVAEHGLTSVVLKTWTCKILASQVILTHKHPPTRILVYFVSHLDVINVIAASF